MENKLSRNWNEFLEEILAEGKNPPKLWADIFTDASCPPAPPHKPPYESPAILSEYQRDMERLESLVAGPVSPRHNNAPRFRGAGAGRVSENARYWQRIGNAASLAVVALVCSCCGFVVFLWK